MKTVTQGDNTDADWSRGGSLRYSQGGPRGLENQKGVDIEKSLGNVLLNDE